MEGKAVFFSLCLRLLVYLSHHHWRSVFCSWFLSGFLGQKATGWATGKATGVIFFVQTTLGLFGVPAFLVTSLLKVARWFKEWYLLDTYLIYYIYLCFFDVKTQHVPKNLPLALAHVFLYVYIPVPFLLDIYICIQGTRGPVPWPVSTLLNSNHQVAEWVSW